MSDIDIPHIDLPVRFEGGRLAYVEQDSVDDQANRVEVVLRYRPGDRPDVPEFGTPGQELKQGGADPDEIERALAQWEPDAETDIEAEPVQAALQNVGVEVTGSG